METGSEGASKFEDSTNSVLFSWAKRSECPEMNNHSTVLVLILQRCRKPGRCCLWSGQAAGSLSLDVNWLGHFSGGKTGCSIGICVIDIRAPEQIFLLECSSRLFRVVPGPDSRL